jgi:hypothetical protein
MPIKGMTESIYYRVLPDKKMKNSRIPGGRGGQQKNEKQAFHQGLQSPPVFSVFYTCSGHGKIDT